MPRPVDLADRLAAEALVAGLDGDDGLDLMPALCRRHHFDGCRSAILRRADTYMARKREVPHA